MVSIEDYVDNPIYKIVGINIDDEDKEIECFISEQNDAQKLIPKVINGYTIVFLKNYMG